MNPSYIFLLMIRFYRLVLSLLKMPCLVRAVPVVFTNPRCRKRRIKAHGALRQLAWAPPNRVVIRGGCVRSRPGQGMSWPSQDLSLIEIDFHGSYWNHRCHHLRHSTFPDVAGDAAAPAQPQPVIPHQCDWHQRNPATGTTTAASAFHSGIKPSVELESENWSRSRLRFSIHIHPAGGLKTWPNHHEAKPCSSTKWR